MQRVTDGGFSKRVAMLMHSEFVTSLDAPTFRSLYEDVADAKSVEDLKPASRRLLKKAAIQVNHEKAWGPEQEQLHPRNHGRFASKPGAGAGDVAQATQGLTADLEQAVQGLLDTAKANEKVVSPAIRDVVKSHGGKMEGFGNRLKTTDSIHSKVQRDVADMPGLDEATAARNIGDALRYTAIFDPEDHAGGVKAVIAQMEQKGFQVHKMKNFWEPGDAYNGINGQFIHPDTGFKFELQFHTPESFEKKQQIHLLYEHFRDSSDAHERRVLWNQMVKASDALTQPPGILDIGSLTRQPAPEGAAVAAGATG